MDENLEKLCWDLYLDYEEEMKINSFTNPLGFFDNDDQEKYEEDNAVIASIDSVQVCHQFSGPLILKKIRQMPPQLTLNLNIPIQLPPGIVGAQLPPQSQQMLQQFQQQVANQTSTMITDQLKRQMPVIAVDLHIEKMKWNKVK